jgi:hypothetical protein
MTDKMPTTLPMLSLYDSMNVPDREKTLQGLVQVGAFLLAESLGPILFILFLTPPLDSLYPRRRKLSNLPKFCAFH